MRKNYWTSVLLVLLGFLMLIGAATRLKPLKQMRLDNNFDHVDTFINKNEVAQLRIPLEALFTLRSLAINYFWIRADTLKMEGQYFDAIQLARVICALQPNLPTVWDFQSWNMAYNISIAMPNPPERWHWIESAIKLLRDDGLKLMPESPKLYHSLGYIFGDKIGRNIDEFHRYYKQHLAFEMMDILGPGIVSNEKLMQMASMPRDWQEVIADPNIAALTEILITAEPRFDNVQDLRNELIDVSISPTDYAPELHQVIDDYRDDYTWKKLDMFVRSEQLRVWLEPEFMLAINNRYGPVDETDPDRRLPLDWRLPYCHAIYWAERGLMHTTDTGMTWLDLRRLQFHSLQNMFHQGKIQILNPNRPNISTSTGDDALKDYVTKYDRLEVEIFNGQDPRMFPVAFQTMMDVIDERAAAGDKAPVGVNSASINLARSLVVNIYLSGHEKLARSAYEQLKQRSPDLPDYQMSLEEFVAGKIREEFESLTPKTAGQFIYSILEKAFLNYAVRNDDISARNENLARQIHQHMEEKSSDETIDRRLLPKYPDMLIMSIKNVLENPTISVSVKQYLINRIQQERPEQFEQVKKVMEIR
ncbi:MAG: hypothetical protein GY869_05735 [Planctomycetes bacterium]|nr:hypothetical protein [Planctomycetota bacterium]